jgi:hydrogenase nickel incorporation protein HypA/HybF
MHELSIAQSIIDIAEVKAREENSRCIQVIKIRLGEFTTVVREALEFAFEVARRETLAESARLEIESVPMVVRCVACGPVTDPMREVCLLCPQCGLPLEVVSGEELQVEYIEIESEAERVQWNAYRFKQTF